MCLYYDSPYPKKVFSFVFCLNQKNPPWAPAVLSFLFKILDLD